MFPFKGISVWDDNKFSLFMGAFYWSYWATELPGGILAQRFGGKKVMGLCVTMAGILNFLLPFACNHDYLLASFVRALQGLSLVRFANVLNSNPTINRYLSVISLLIRFKCVRIERTSVQHFKYTFRARNQNIQRETERRSTCLLTHGRNVT